MTRIVTVLLLLCALLTAASCAPMAAATPSPASNATDIAADTPSPAPQPTPIMGAPLPDGLRRGVNLGNMLEATYEGEWGSTFKDEYAGIIREAGFDYVRLPVRWSAHVSGAHNTIKPQFYERVDHVIDTLLDAGLGVILNIHHFNEMNDDPEGNAALLYRIWDQLAAHYADLPDSVVFEVFNEPSGVIGTSIWNKYQNRCIEVIRRFNPTRKILITAAEWGGPSGLQRLNPPDDPNLLASFHYYDPFRFTHQGADWVAGADAYMGTTWTGTDDERKDIDDTFRRAARWSAQHGIPLVLGEFGAYSMAPMDDRALWTAYTRETAEKYGFAWCYWEFCSGFGVYDQSTGQYVDALRDALLPPE